MKRSIKHTALCTRARWAPPRPRSQSLKQAHLQACDPALAGHVGGDWIVLVEEGNRKADDERLARARGGARVGTRLVGRRDTQSAEGVGQKETRVWTSDGADLKVAHAASGPRGFFATR